MNKYCFEFKEGKPKYIQIYNNISQLIFNKGILEEEKLPSIRELSKALNVNKDTIISAYDKLCQEGYAYQKIGSGTYAKHRDASRNFRKRYSDILKKMTNSNRENIIDFTGETAASDLLPIDIFKNVLNEVLDRDGVESLIYQEFLGYEGLRESISKYFWENEIDIDNILIVSGAQQGIDIISKAIISVNDNVIVEKPTYGGALSVFQWRKTNIFEVSISEDGIDLKEFEKILKRNKIKCFYTMSYFQNPTGISYSYKNKIEILKLAEKYDFYIIEDDYLSELIYDVDIEYSSFKKLDKNDRVIYIKSFSKIFLPGIRIGYVITPKIFKESIQNSKINTDISTSSLMQRTLDLYIKKGYWKEHIAYLNSIYSKRYNIMKEQIQELLRDKCSVIIPGGGLSFYFTLFDNYNIDCIELFNCCKEKGVLITPGVLFYKYPNEGNKGFKLSFSQLGEKKIVKGVNIINTILETYKN